MHCRAAFITATCCESHFLRGHTVAKVRCSRGSLNTSPIAAHLANSTMQLTAQKPLCGLSRPQQHRSIGAAAPHRRPVTHRNVSAAFKVEDATDPGTTSASVRRPSPPMYDPGPSSVLAMILGGGSSDYDKLFPLTARRALPAIPVAGQHRLVDIPISNLVNSGIKKIYVLTQFQSQSLNRYLTKTYNLSDGVPVGGEAFIELLTSTVSPQRDRWSLGTADAVRQFEWILSDVRRRQTIQDVIILPADQIYQVDFNDALTQHRRLGADMTILCHPVTEDQVRCSDSDEACCDVSAFIEKPQGVALEVMRTSPDVMRSFYRSNGREVDPAQATAELAQEDEPLPFIASTGIYIFNRNTLIDVLKQEEDANDFGSDIIPRLVNDGLKVIAVHLPGPWRDVGGSLKDFYDSSLEMLCEQAPTILDSLRLSRKPIYKSTEALPPITYAGPPSKVTTSYIAPGAKIGGGCIINHSIVGIRSIIGSECKIYDSLVMGADYYGPNASTVPRDNIATSSSGSSAGADDSSSSAPSASVPKQPQQPSLGVGDRCVIRKAIVDKNAKIGNDVHLINATGAYNSADYSALGVWIRDGIIVVTKSASIPDGTII